MNIIYYYACSLGRTTHRSHVPSTVTSREGDGTKSITNTNTTSKDADKLHFSD